MTDPIVDHRSLYRLPWSLTDNPIAWLEPTQACNLACDGCYRENVNQHKSVEEVRAELQIFEDLRNYDGVSIAGGDPLLYPKLPDLIREVRRMGRKAIINTNGVAMTKELLVTLKEAGLLGLTFHVDSKQGRPGWRDKTEKEMNELRQEYADMVDEVGGLACAFNSTVYGDTLDQVPDVMDWATRNIGKVHTCVFILFRAAKPEQYNYFADGKEVDIEPLVYTEDSERRTDIHAREVVEVIRNGGYPDFEPCAYLNGTEDPSAFKWLMSLRMGTEGKSHGYLGPKFMEFTQSAYHLLTNRYLSYAPSWMLSTGRSAMTYGLFDSGVRKTARSFAKHLVRKPMDILKKQHLQSILIIQPIDIMEDGRASMCDGCPDMTVHDGKLVWSCRLEEQREYGCWLQAVPKEKETKVSSKKNGHTNLEVLS